MIEHTQRLAELFESATELAPSERQPFLARACAGNSSLLAELHSLLDADTRAAAADFLEQSALEIEARRIAFEPAETRAGETLGRYRLLELIGEGGMGEVYLAEDTEVVRRVAVKLIKGGLRTKEVLRRFRGEQQILANLKHPNIATLLDAGSTAEGLPFYVMEYVEGRPVNAYCDERGLSTEERLRLFREICAAVAYAHRNLVVHRDLKPSNILVTAEGVPKLLDFGIAKLLDAGASVQETATMLRALTPEYASPEQVKGAPITTATDVYSLGVILYELLTGRSPYKPEGRALREQLASAVCEQQPLKPSAARRDAAMRELEGVERKESYTEVSAGMRGGVPASRLRGDLDNIVLMALRKEPERRYPSVEQFSEDIRRHLEGLPVVAHRDTFAYRAGKFVRRNRAATAAAALALLTLVGGIIATARQARVARAERARAERRFEDAHQLANSLIFELHDAINEIPGTLRARQLMTQRALEYLDRLAQDRQDDPSLQRELAAAYLKIGDVQGYPHLSNLGDTSGALASYGKAAAILTALSSADPANAENRRELSVAADKMAAVQSVRGDYGAALENLRRSLAIREALSASDPGNPELRRLVADSYRRIGDALGDDLEFNGAVADLPAGLESYQRAFGIIEELSARNPADVQGRRLLAILHQRLGKCLIRIGEATKDAEAFRRALEHHRAALNIWVETATDPADANGRFPAGEYEYLGNAQVGLGDLADALKNYERAETIFEAQAAREPANSAFRWELVRLYQAKARALAKLDRVAEAAKYERQAVQVAEFLFADDPQRITDTYPALFSGYKTLGELASRAGDSANAAAYYRKAVEYGERWSQAAHAHADLRAALAEVYSRLGKQ